MCDDIARTNYVRVFIVAIRKKLEPDPSHPPYFVTAPGSGLRFEPDGILPSGEPPAAADDA